MHRITKLFAAIKWQKYPRIFASSIGKITTSDNNEYRRDFERSIKDSESFWAEQASRIDWHKKWVKVLDNDRQPFTKWFVGGQLNICYNALDRHVLAENGERKALIYDSPLTKITKCYTYSELLDQVRSLSSVLRKHGVTKGDRVLIYMPMIPEAIVAMLSVVRLGAIHIVVFGGFASKELSVRINHSTPKLIITASAGLEPRRIIPYKPMVDNAIEMCEFKPKAVLFYRRPDIDVPNPMIFGRDFDWNDEMSKSGRGCEAVPVDANDPMYILHTSGTTGLPKGVVRPTGGYAVVMPWSMQKVYGMNSGEIWWSSSDLGWAVGHSYVCYGPLLAGLTTVLYEGKPVETPDAGQFFRVISQHNVHMVFTTPTALRAIHQKDPHCEFGAKYKMKYLRAIHSAGEHLDYETRLWAQGKDKFGVPIFDHWWQTETGWPICAHCLGYYNTILDPKKDSTGLPVPGWDVKVFDESGKVASNNKLGRIVIKLPLPPGSLSSFWQNDQLFASTYFDKYPVHGGK